jgi:hypothetical protein
VPLAALSSACNCIAALKANDDSAATAQGSPVTIDVLANDTPGTLSTNVTIINVSAPKAGTTTITGGQVLYVPNTNFLGNDSFTYTISDGVSTSSATVNVKVFFYDGNLWLPFNQTAGFSTEDAGGAFTANLSGFANDPLQWVAGKWNKALQFDGVANQAVVTGYKGILGASNRTVAAWLKTSTIGSFVSWGPKVTGQKWIMRVQAENGAPGALRVEVEGGYIVGTADLRDGLWHHVAAVFTNDNSSVTNIKLYVDGSLEPVSAEQTQTVNTQAGGDLLIGTDIQGRYFAGTLDELRIFSRALGAAEIHSLITATNQSAAAWYLRYFGAASANWMRDDDGDGAACLLEYAMGGQPWIADAPRMRVQAQIAGNHLQVRFPRRLAGTHELNYAVQASPDLRDWSTLTASEIGSTPLADQPGFEQAIFQADDSVSARSPLFLRLMVGFN